MVAPDSRAKLARRQAETPLITLSKFPEPALLSQGDPDIDFMTQMRVHHTGAIEMAKVALGQESWLRKFGQCDKWSFCLTAGKIGPRIRSNHEQTTTPESHSGIQGQGGLSGHQRRPDVISDSGAVRRPPQSDCNMEGSASRRSCRGFRPWRRQCSIATVSRCEGSAREDWRADARE